MIEIRFFETPNGTDAETLWREGMQLHLDAGTVAPGAGSQAGFIRHGAWAWVAYVDGQPGAVQVSMPHPEDGTCDGLLTYVRPAFRGLRLYSEIQPAMDAELLMRGFTHATFWMPDTPTADRLAAAVLARGGELVGEETVELRCGSTRIRHFRRQLRGATQ